MNIESFKDIESRYSSTDHYLQVIEKEVGSNINDLINRINEDLISCSKREWGLIRPALAELKKCR